MPRPATQKPTVLTASCRSVSMLCVSSRSSMKSRSPSLLRFLPCRAEVADVSHVLRHNGFMALGFRDLHSSTRSLLRFLPAARKAASGQHLCHVGCTLPSSPVSCRPKIKNVGRVLRLEGFDSRALGSNIPQGTCLTHGAASQGRASEHRIVFVSLGTLKALQAAPMLHSLLALSPKS